MKQTIAVLCQTDAQKYKIKGYITAISLEKAQRRQAIEEKNGLQSLTHQSNFELTSKENVDSMGVIASSAVCMLQET